MWRKLTLAVMMVLSVVMGAFSVYAQTNAGAGNQGSTTNRPRIDIIKRDITTFKENQITEINANASQLNILADDILREVLRVRGLINSYATPQETDPHVIALMRQDGTSQCASVTCADDQKLHWDGATWRCLSAVLPTCGAGTIFSTVTCTCVNPCTNPGEVPDNNGTCCQPTQIQAGECRTCPTHSTWDGADCRCNDSNSIVASDGICCPPNSTPAPGNAMCICTASGDPVPGMPLGTCGATCPTPGHTPDANGACCAAATMVNGLCPGGCPSGTVPDNNGTCCPQASIVSGLCVTGCPMGQAPDANGVCCAAATMVGGLCPGGNTCPPDRLIPFAASFYPGQCCPEGTIHAAGLCRCSNGATIAPNGTCPACPVGTTNAPNGQCTCPSGQIIAMNGTCTVCSSGYALDNTWSCCPIENLEFGNPGDQCIGGLTCGAGAFANCSLPETTVNANQSTYVVGVCAANLVPVGGASACGATCQAGANSANYASPNVGCETNCPAHLVPNPAGTPACVCPDAGQESCGSACYAPCPSGQSRNESCACVISSCSGTNENPTPVNGQCVCASGFERVNGACVAECGENQVRNGSGQCVCAPNYERWPNNASGTCIPMAPTLIAGCMVDTNGEDVFQSGNCSGSGPGTGSTNWTVGNECGGSPCQGMYFTGQWSSRFSVQWTGACNSSTHYCSKEARGGGTARVRVTDELKGIIVLDENITATDNTCDQSDPECQGGPI